MKKYIILFILFLALGCGTVKEFFSKSEPQHEEMRPPEPHEVILNPDGTYTVKIDDSLNNKKPVNLSKYFYISGLLIVSGLTARYLLKDLKE